MKKLLVIIGIFLFSFLSINQGPGDDYSGNPFNPTSYINLGNPFTVSYPRRLEFSTPYPIITLACSPDGEFFMTNKQIIVCKATHEERAVSDLVAEEAYDKISISASGLTASTVDGEENKIYIKNPRQKEEILKEIISTEKITHLAWHPTANILATANTKGMVSLWRPFLEKNEQVVAERNFFINNKVVTFGKFNVSEKPHLRLSWSPDGTLLAVVSNNQVFFLRFQDKKCSADKKLFRVHYYYHPSKIEVFYWRTNELFTSISDDKTHISWDFDTKTKTQTTENIAIKYLACSPDGRYIASVDGNNTLKIFIKNKLVYDQEECFPISHIEWLPESDTLLVVTKTNSFSVPGDTILFIDMPDEDS